MVTLFCKDFYSAWLTRGEGAERNRCCSETGAKMETAEGRRQDRTVLLGESSETSLLSTKRLTWGPSTVQRVEDNGSRFLSLLVPICISKIGRF